MKIKTHRTLALAASLALIFAVNGFAQTPAPAAKRTWFDSFRTFSIYLENDVLAKWMKDTTDESYTQGLRLTWDFAQFPAWAQKLEKLSGVGLFHDSRTISNKCRPDVDRSIPCGSISFGLGQTMYSPTNILTTARQTNDQPFAGWLFASAATLTRDDDVQASTELVVGVVGPASLSEHTQRLAHWTWSSGAGIPRGWPHQLRQSAHAGIIQSYAWHAFERCSGASGEGGSSDDNCTGVRAEGRWLDVTPRAELVATTLMTRASIGATLRVGKGFPDRVGIRIPATGREAGTSEAWWSVFASGDARAVFSNAFIEGSYADDGPTGWRAVRQIDARRSVNEFAVGLSAGWRPVTLSVQGVSRSLEWDPRPGVSTIARASRHRYLSLMISLNQGTTRIQ